MQQVDVIVLGAGIVGVSTAVHLQNRGLDVALIDRGQPGEEASMGTAGLIARNGFCSARIPSDPEVLFDIVFKQSTALRYDFGTLIRMIPWLRSYARHYGIEGAQTYARAMAPLRACAVSEHRTLARQARVDRFYRKNGWLQVFRSEASFATGERERHYARIYGVEYQELDEGELLTVEPALRDCPFRGVFWPESESVVNPGAITEALWRHFIQKGGAFLNGDGYRLELRRGGWWIPTMRQDLMAKDVVLSAGSWSADLAARHGDKFPLAVSRGYNLQFQPKSGTSLSRPVMDMDHGYMISPMEQGIRITTGMEIVRRDAPPSPIQLASACRRAEDVLELGRLLPDDPWMGCRPLLPDGLPVVGKSPSVPGLWYNFGHADYGFALGPAFGRLLAEQLCHEQTFVEAAPFSPSRFIRFQ